MRRKQREAVARGQSRSWPGLTSTAFASRRSVEIFGSRFPASIRLTSVTWTPLRCATSSWVIPKRSRASRNLVPKSATAGIVCAGDRIRHRKVHKSLRRLPPSMPPRDEDGGAGHGPHASGPRPAPSLWRALGVLHNVHAGVDVRNLRDLHPGHLPSLLVGGLSAERGGMLKKIPLRTKILPDGTFRP